MDKNRPPHLPRKRPVVTIEGDAATVQSVADAPAAAHAVVETVAETASGTTSGAADHNAAAASEPLPDIESLKAEAPVDEPSGNADPNAEPQVNAAPPSSPPSATRASRGGSITSGVVGAVLALGGGFGLQTLGYLPSPTGAEQRVAALESQLQALGAQDAGDVEGEVAALKDSIAALTAATAASADLVTRLAALEEKVAAAPAASGAVDPAIFDRLSALESRVQADGDASGGLEQLGAETKAAIATLKAEIASLEARLEARNSDPNLAAAVAATALRAAVDRGGPFAGELETLATFQPDSPAVEALRAFAASGVPPRTEIIAGFEEAASAMLAADAPVNPDATLLERLMDGVRGLVRVRPVGDVEGDTTGARIARIGEALTRSDDAAVETEFAALAAPVRVAGEPFMQRFRARAEADRLIAEAVRAAAAGSGG